MPSVVVTPYVTERWDRRAGGLKTIRKYRIEFGLYRIADLDDERMARLTANQMTELLRSVQATQMDIGDPVFEPMVKEGRR